MNHDNDYHETINYGNRFPDDWFFNCEIDLVLNDINSVTHEEVN